MSELRFNDLTHLIIRYSNSKFLTYSHNYFSMFRYSSSYSVISKLITL